MSACRGLNGSNVILGLSFVYGNNFSFDIRFDFCRNFLCVIFERFLSGVYHLFSNVSSFNQFFLLGVFSCVFLGFLLHTFDVGFGQARRCFNTD